MNQLTMIHWIMTPTKSQPDIFKAAVEHGSLDNWRWLLKRGVPNANSDISVAAAKKGCWDITKWLATKYVPFEDDSRMIKWLFDHKFPIVNDSKIFKNGIQTGN